MRMWRSGRVGREEGDGNCHLANRNISLRLLSRDESGRRFCVLEASINFDKPPSSVALEAWRTSLRIFFCYCMLLLRLAPQRHLMINSSEDWDFDVSRANLAC